METTNTACGHFGCDVRIARGLTPFCQMETPAPTNDGAPVFGSMAEAKDYIAKHGGVAVRSGGMGHGPLKVITRRG